MSKETLKPEAEIRAEVHGELSAVIARREELLIVKTHNAERNIKRMAKSHRKEVARITANFEVILNKRLAKLKRLAVATDSTTALKEPNVFSELGFIEKELTSLSEDRSDYAYRSVLKSRARFLQLETEGLQDDLAEQKYLDKLNAAKAAFTV